MIFNRKSMIDIMKGAKTQTRRPIASEEALDAPPWRRGQTIAMQPGRGQRHVGHLLVLAVRHERVRDISLQDAIREGYKNHEDYLRTWTRELYPDARDPRHDVNRRCWVITFGVARSCENCAPMPDYVLEEVNSRPAPVVILEGEDGPQTRSMLKGEDDDE